MHFQYVPYIWLLIVSAISTFSVGIYALVKRRSAKGAIRFITCVIILTIWSAGNALEICAIDLPTKLFWANFQYFAYCYLPVAALSLSLEFTGFDNLVKNKKILWAGVIPTLILLLVWTDGMHGLMRYDMHLEYNGAFLVIAKKYGPAFYIHAAYSHCLNITAWLLLIRAAFYKNATYRKQAAALAIGVSFIIIPNILFVLRITPIKHMDIAPIFFGPAGLVGALALFRYKIFDLVPLARATVIETMNAGIMVADEQDRILDINPAFEKIIGFPASKVSSKSVHEVFKEIPELANVYTDGYAAYTEFTVQIDGLRTVYEAKLSPLLDAKGKLIGRVMVVYEITEKKEAEERLRKQQWELAVIEERERMANNLHDNLGQVLGFMNLQAQGIRQELVNAGVETGLKRIDKLIDATQSAHNEIREYIKEARNSALIERDFVTALKRHISHFEEQTGIRVQLNLLENFGEDKLLPSVRLNILYIIKEALNNVCKHAQAQNVKIGFYATKKEMGIVVEDDGKGFDIDQQPRRSNSSFGLSIMQERAAEIGAQIGIQSLVGKGTRITLSLLTLEGEEKSHEINVS